MIKYCFAFYIIRLIIISNQCVVNIKILKLVFALKLSFAHKSFEFQHSVMGWLVVDLLSTLYYLILLRLKCRYEHIYITDYSQLLSANSVLLKIANWTLQRNNIGIQCEFFVISLWTTSKQSGYHCLSNMNNHCIHGPTKWNTIHLIHLHEKDETNS